MKQVVSRLLIISSLLMLVACSGGGGDSTPKVSLNSISIVDGNLDQVFQAIQPGYTASVGFLAKSIKISATTVIAGATITVNGVAIGADNISQAIALVEGVNAAINIIVTAANGTTKKYTVTVTRAIAADFAEQAYVKASSTKVNDWFGYTVALSGDTLAVGAYFEDSSSTGINSTPTDDGTADSSGAVYVFTRSGTTWTQQAYIKASNTGGLDRFGISIALSGDTLAVGAYGEGSSSTGINSTPNDAATSAGAAYVFTRSGTTWTQQAYIKASNAGAGDFFGDSVALSGDTLAVGADIEASNSTGINSTPNDDGTATSSGAVYVFTRSGTTWTQQAYIKASNTGAYDWFGDSVALSGDTLAVGASIEDSNTTGINSTPNDDGTANSSGAVYVFTRSGTTWTQQAYIKASNTGTGDYFGYSVVLSDDTLVVGAYGEDSNSTGINSTSNDLATNSGAAYVFIRSGTTWTQQAYVKASNTEANDNFGRIVALAGDTFAVGALAENSSTTGINSTPDNAANAAGAVYVFIRSGTTWTQQAYVKASNTEANDYFGGEGVALSGDTLVAGAYGEDSNSTGIDSTPNDDGTANGSGAVYVFK